MSEAGNFPDSSGVPVRPPIVWGLTVVAGLLLHWLRPLPFLPTGAPAGLLGGLVFLAGLALLIWAAVTFRRAGTEVQTSRPTTRIVAHGPYRYSRNPIYVGMFLGLAGLALGFNSLWLLVLLAPFYLVIRYAVVARDCVGTNSPEDYNAAINYMEKIFDVFDSQEIIRSWSKSGRRS